MLNLLKLLTLVSLFKDVTAEVQAAGNTDRPWYLQRTFWGACMAALSGVVAMALGVQLNADQLSTLADNIPQLISAITGVWGSVLFVYGAIMKAIKAKQA